MPRAQEYREMLLILLRRSFHFAILKCDDAVKKEVCPPAFFARVVIVARRMHYKSKYAFAGLTFRITCDILLFARRKTNVAG